MNDLEKQLKEAFGSVHAEEPLKASAEAFLAEEREKRRKASAARWVRMAAAAACMVLLLLTGYGTRMYLEPVSVVSIDINPSLELGINAFNRVVSVQAYNEDGKALAETLELRFLNYVDAVERVVHSDTVSELMHRNEELILTVVGDDETQTKALCAELEANVSDAGSVHCFHAEPQTVAEAHHCGLSYGKYLAYLEALKQNEALKPEDVQGMTMKEIRKLSGASCGHGHHESWTEETLPLTEETTVPTEALHGSHGKNRHTNGHH